MTVCLVPDFTAVNMTLEHLGEVDKQLRADGVPFSQEASHHLSQIAEAIKELEASRRAVHEELEVETIEMGKLRHRLLRQRHDAIAEISAAVAAARDANMAEINQLQLETANIMQEIESMEKRRKLLEEQNDLLLPEQEFLNPVYTELIEKLNKQLSDKAKTQIALNETRKEIQSTREKITGVHTARKDLQENLIKVRMQFEETKKMLEKETDEMVITIQEQTKMNAEINKELGVVLVKLMKKEERVDKLSNHVSLLERNVVRLKTSQQNHEEEIKDKLEKSGELTKQKELCEKELQDLRDTLNQQLLGLQENIGAVEQEIEEEQKKNNVHLDTIAKLSSIFRDQKRTEDDALAAHSSLNKELGKSKQRLDECCISIERYKLNIKKMEEVMKQLHEDNKASVELFQKNMVELKGQVAKEKKSRAAFEVEKEDLRLQIETLKEQHEDSVMRLHSTISLHKTKYNQLVKEKETLEEHETPMDSLIKELTHQIWGVLEECEQTELTYNNEIKQLNMEAEAVSRARLDEEKEMMDQESVLSKVKAQFNTDHSQHQALKQQTNELNIRKSHLELSIQEVKERIAVMLMPKEELKKELQTLRENHLELLRSLTEQISTTERGIYETGLMLEQVTMENSRLRLRIEQMNEDIVNASREKEKQTQEMGWMKEEVPSIYRSLVDAWTKDKLATEDSSKNDQKYLESMRTFMLQVQERTQHIGDISIRLGAELKAMSKLLEINGSQQNLALKKNESRRKR